MANGKKKIIQAVAISDEVTQLIALFKGHFNRDTRLSPAEIQQFYDLPDMEASMETMLEYENTLHPLDDADDNSDADDGGDEAHMVPDPTKDISITGNREAKALWYDLSQNKEFAESLVDAVATDRKRKRSSATVAYNLSKTPDIALTLKGYPYPGTRFDDDHVIKLKTNNPGRNFKVDVEKAGEESFWNKTYGQSPEGLSLAKYIAALKLLKADQTNKLALADYPHCAKKSKDWIEAELKQETTAFNVGAGHMKDAVKTILNMDSITKDLNGIRVSFREETTDGVKSLERRTAAVRIWTYLLIDEKGPNTPDNKYAVEKFFSIPTFLKITAAHGEIWPKVVGAKTPADQFALMVVPKKPRETKQQKADAAARKQAAVFLDNTTAVESGFITFALSLEKEAGFATKIREKLNSAGSDEFLLSVFKVADFCDAITRIPAYLERVAALTEQGQKKKVA